MIVHMLFFHNMMSFRHLVCSPLCHQYLDRVCLFSIIQSVESWSNLVPEKICDYEKKGTVQSATESQLRRGHLHTNMSLTSTSRRRGQYGSLLDGRT